jgi:hypothetical protein
MIVQGASGADASGQATKEPATSGTAKMAQRLEQLAKSADPNGNITVKWEERIAYRMDQFQNGPNISSKITNGLVAGVEMVRAGKPEDGLRQYSAVRRFMQQNEIPLTPEDLRSIVSLLATAHLRRGEQQNCIARCSSGACIFPIRDDGVHVNQDGSRLAMKTIGMLLQSHPDDLAMRWLLSLAAMTVGEYPDGVPAKWRIPPSVFESEFDIKEFPNVSAKTGVNMLGLSGGVVTEDFDRDGFIDIMASDWGMQEQLRFFKNNGDGTFKDKTEDAKLIGEVGGLNLTHADYNNDGFADVLLLRGAWLGEHGKHPNSLLRNNGDGTFSDVTEAAGLLSFFPTQTATWGDFDNDGWIDLFIGNESTEKAYPCELYKNNGDGTFSDVATSVGVAHVGFVKGVAWGDMDNDGLLDLYISRMNQSNVLLHNDGPVDGQWRFTDVTAQAVVGEPKRSFATWWWDFDNDGWLDIFVAAFSGFSGNTLHEIAADYWGLPSKAPRARLYRNNQDGSFTEVSKAVGLDHTMLAMGANYGDLDNDGYPDLYLGTGEPDLKSLVPNRVYRNDRGRAFQNVTWSSRMGHLQKGHGVSFADIDNDGDQDVYAVMGGAFIGDVAYNALFLNPGHDHHWITLRLEGSTSNRAGIGARIRVHVNGKDDPRTIHAVVGTGGSFGSSSLQQEIGLGNATAIDSVEIVWPGETTAQVFENVAVDAAYLIRQGSDQPSKVSLRESAAPTGFGTSPHVGSRCKHRAN